MSLTKYALASMALLCLAHPASASGGAQEPVRVGGTGAALELMDRVSVAYSAISTAPRAKILPSLGSSGGLRALAAGAVDIALIARRITPDETHAGMSEAACLRTPFVLATPVPQAPAMTSADLVRIYGEPLALWPDGSRIKLILRPEGGSGNHLLTTLIPGMEEAMTAARRRSEIPLAMTDQDNAELAERTNGSLTAMGLAQLISERRALHPIALDGVPPTAETLAAGAYKARMELCLIVGPAMTPAVAGFVAFLRSERGRAVLGANGALPLDAP